MSDNLKSIKDVWCYLSGLVFMYLWHFAFDTYNKTRCEIRCILYFCIFTCRFQLHVFTHSVFISSNTYLQFSSIWNVLKKSTTTVWCFVSLCVFDWWDPLCKVMLWPNQISWDLGLTHWGRVTHICVGKLTIIGSDNGLSPERRQAIIWTNARIVLIGPLGTTFSEILIEIQTFPLKKIRLKISSAKCCSFRLGLNVLRCVSDGYHILHSTPVVFQQ